YSSTLPVTLDEMIHHAKAVCRGVDRALVVCDLPFMSYQVSVTQAIETAGRMMKETEASGIKLEGGQPKMLEIVKELTTIGIPVMGHVGLTPQSFRILGYKQQGKIEEEANLIIDRAISLEQAGAFSIILEHIPSELAGKITSKLAIPTIGIGAGNQCDGQVLVTADFLGLSERQPPFAKSYVDLRQYITNAVEEFKQEVQNKKFPSK
ncbi:MAG: 3-methyl-2-oxobutanoate hydroxymethyltransferase, partial [Pleurocapsa sp.]